MTQPTEASHPNGDFGFGGKARHTVKLVLKDDARPTSLQTIPLVFYERETHRKKKG